jgi:tetratricopeptide (TPR) repeat protein
MTRAPHRRPHPERGSLERFLCGSLPDREDRRVEEHLRRPCLRCLFDARELALGCTEASRHYLREALFGGDGRTTDGLDCYSRWLERKVLLIDLERSLVPDLTAELMLRPPEARRESVRKSRRYQVLALADALREESRSEGFRDVARSVELGELAIEVADCLAPSFYGPRLVSDARALAYANLGNARRVAGDLFGAERQLRAAFDLLASGTGAATERAEVLSLLASLRTDQSRFAEAISLLVPVTATYREQGDDRLEGKTLLKVAMACSLGGEPNRALGPLEHAIELLDRVGEERLAFLGRHNIVSTLVDAERHEEARTFLREIAPLYEEQGADRSMELRRRWVEGLIAAGLEELDEAEAILQEVRSVFMEEDRAFDHALITLDLSTLYLETGRTQEVKRLAEELYPVFRSQDVHRQALAALVLFKQAALTEAATIGFTRRLAEYLKRARNNPYLPFEPGDDG